MNRISISDVRMGDVVRDGTGNEVRLGTAENAPVLVTRTAGHRAPLIGYELAYDDITPLACLDPEVLVEWLPLGRPASDAGQLDAQRIRDLGIRIARVLERVHADGVVIDGIRPELIYLDGDARLTALVPRGPRFTASAIEVGAGFGSYAMPYVGHESVALGNPSSAATDVFALCATLFALGTGRHPFGESVPEAAMRIMRHQPDDWDGDLGVLVSRGLAQVPSDRPTASELLRALAT